MKLAFDIGEIGGRFWTSAISLPVVEPGPAVLALGIGDEVLLYGVNDGVVAVYCAIARFNGLERQADGAVSAVILDQLDWFGSPVPMTDFTAIKSGWESLSDEAFAAIAGRGLSPQPETFDQRLVQAGVSRAATLETYAAISGQALASFGFACALTGQSEAGKVQVVPIRPRPLGGRLHVGNFLPLTEAAAHAFTNLHLTIGGGFEVIADLSRIDPELLEQLNPLGRLAVPPDVFRHPDRESLAWHRKQFFDRLGG